MESLCLFNFGLRSRIKNIRRNQTIKLVRALPQHPKLREQLRDLSRKINTEVHPVFTSHKIKDELKAKEPKPPIVNQQNVVYIFKCFLCDADYVGYTCRHLHQRVEEHKRSVIGNHIREQHGNEPHEIAKNFRVLRKCSNILPDF